MRDEVRRLFRMDLVIRLRDARRCSGFTQAKVAKLAGIGPQTLSSFETGARIDSLTVVRLLKILKVYGITPSDFFGRTSEVEK